MAAKRRPLAERVTWESSKEKYLSCCVGGIAIVIDGRYGKKWNLWTNQLDIDVILKATTERAAKAEALRIVQAAVLAAAAEWED